MDAARGAIWPGMASRRNDGSEGTPAKPGPDDGASPFGSFWGDCQKGLARQGETETRRTLGHEPGPETHPHHPMPT